jgi:hypothetical protein
MLVLVLIVLELLVGAGVAGGVRGVLQHRDAVHRRRASMRCSTRENWEFVAVYLRAVGSVFAAHGVCDHRGVHPDDPGPGHRR